MLRALLQSFALAGIASLGCAALFGSTAQAQDIHPAFAPEPNVHDGFYLRFGSGLGVYDEDLHSADSSVYGGKVEARSRGIATQSEFALGGTIARGLVLGGGIYSGDLIASTFKNGKNSPGVPPPELDPQLRNFFLIGPFVDWYLNPRRGFHLQGALGLAAFTPRVFGSSATERSKYAAVGGGLMLGTGYEWWLADEWSLGILGRLTANVVTGKDDADVRWTHVIVTSPSFLVSITYH